MAGFSRHSLSTSPEPTLQRLGLTEIRLPDGATFKLCIWTVTAIVDRGKIDFITFYSEQLTQADVIAWLQASEKSLNADLETGISRWLADEPTARHTAPGWAIAEVARGYRVGVSVDRTLNPETPYRIGLEVTPPR